MKKSYKQIQEEGEAHAALLADILGVKQGKDFKATRKNLNAHLGMGKSSSDDTELPVGWHPDGRASTLDELMIRYLDGSLANKYELPIAVNAPTVEWFNASDKSAYRASDGFHPSCEAFEFTTVWYQLMGEELSLAGCGDWSVEHGGLRWVAQGSAAVDHDAAEAAIANAFSRYQEFHAAVLIGYEPVQTVEVTDDATSSDELLFSADELLSLLGEEEE